MANATKCEGRQEVPRASKLLQTLMGVTKVKLVIKLVCAFIRDKGDRHKSEICNLRDGSELYANK